ncbi:hypothetical protein ACVWZV_004383 [Bradyrhizobium sp. GM5.1]
MAEPGAGAGVDDDDLQRRQRMPDPPQLLLDVVGARHVAVGQMPEVELHAGLKTPFQRDLVDRP